MPNSDTIAGDIRALRQALEDHIAACFNRREEEIRLEAIASAAHVAATAAAAAAQVAATAVAAAADLITTAAAVSLGKHPHTPWRGSPTTEDRPLLSPKIVNAIVLSIAAAAGATAWAALENWFFAPKSVLAPVPVVAPLVPVPGPVVPAPATTVPLLPWHTP